MEMTGSGFWIRNSKILDPNPVPDPAWDPTVFEKFHFKEEPRNAFCRNIFVQYLYNIILYNYCKIFPIQAINVNVNTGTGSDSELKKVQGHVNPML